MTQHLGFRAVGYDQRKGFGGLRVPAWKDLLGWKSARRTNTSSKLAMQLANDGWVRTQSMIGSVPIITLIATPLRSHKFFRSPSFTALA